MKIVIFAGGTGSISLQRGMYHALEESLDGIDTKIIVNAYDNGLSTGAVRTALGGRILGPSDVRKNQATRLHIVDPTNPWLKFLGHRFSCRSAAAMDFCIAQTKLLSKALDSRAVFYLLSGSIETFFRFPAAAELTYEDFSLANIVYAGLCANNGHSLRKAATIMADAIGIPDNVLLNDDTPLYLGAITRSGRRVHDEAQIVAWDDAQDPFVDVFFVDPAGNQAKPELCLEAWKAIVDADIVVLSAGTQWSSLIPTYESGGFRDAIDASKATVMLVMNRVPDRDSPGLTGSALVDLLVPKYFAPGRVHVLADRNGHGNFQQLEARARQKVASFTSIDLSSPQTPPNEHDPSKLSDAVARVYFGDYIDSDIFVFDYDDTLCSRERDHLLRTNRINVNEISRLNLKTRIAICTGNTIEVVQRGIGVKDSDVDDDAPLHVFADGGVNEYVLRPRTPAPAGLIPARCISPDVLLPECGPHSPGEIVNALARAGIPREMISNRGNALIAIRPIDTRDRPAVMHLARKIVNGAGLDVRETGTSTVEICRPTLSKAFALKHLLALSSSPLRMTYVGDELDSGNDRSIADLSRDTPEIKCLQVHGPAKTAYFIRTLAIHLNRDERH